MQPADDIPFETRFLLAVERLDNMAKADEAPTSVPFETAVGLQQKAARCHSVHEANEVLWSGQSSLIEAWARIALFRFHEINLAAIELMAERRLLAAPSLVRGLFEQACFGFEVGGAVTAMAKELKRADLTRKLVSSTDHELVLYRAMYGTQSSDKLEASRMIDLKIMLGILAKIEAENGADRVTEVWVKLSDLTHANSLGRSTLARPENVRSTSEWTTGVYNPSWETGVTEFLKKVMIWSIETMLDGIMRSREAAVEIRRVLNPPSATPVAAKQVFR
jgi:hypothetical protein